MEHKDIWMVLGLTIVLAVAVSFSTMAITGNVIAKKTTIQKAPSTTIPKINFCEPSWVNFMELGKTYDAYGKKIVLESIVFDGKSSGKVKITIDGEPIILSQATEFNNNLGTIKGLTFKVRDLIWVNNPSEGISSAMVFIANCQPISKC